MIPPQEIAVNLALLAHRGPAYVLRYLAASVHHSNTSSGGKILDASDFRAWLQEIAVELDQLEQKAGAA